jgi:hypothetical protein
MMRRARGVLLRLVRRRAGAVLVGLVLLLPAAWIQLRGHDGAWWLDGLTMVIGATGAALVWAGLTGRRGDWIE